MSDCLDDELCGFSLQEVVGERVVLRPLGEADVQPLFELIDESREFLSVRLPWPGEECFTPEDVFAKIEAWNLQAQMANGACWGIFEKAAGGSEGAGTSAGLKIAGCIMLGWVQWKNRSATVSYWLGKDFCGRGLATEALLLVAGESFAMGLNRLELTAAVNNPKSAAVALRAGFTEEGVCREYDDYVVKGQKKTEPKLGLFSYWDLDANGFRSFDIRKNITIIQTVIKSNE